MESQAFANPYPDMFSPCPHFTDTMNRNIIRSEVEGGVYLRDLAPGSVLSISTMNRVYELKILGGGAARISGHPEFCPEPIDVQIQGSTWGGSVLKVHFVGRGMHLEFEHPLHRRIVTSPIVDIREH